MNKKLKQTSTYKSGRHQNSIMDMHCLTNSVLFRDVRANCFCPSLLRRWRQNVGRTRGDSRVCHWLTTFWRPLWSVYWTDARQHGIYLFSTIKKQTTTDFLFQNSKADLCPLRRTRKKPFGCCQTENEAISLVAIRSKWIVIGPGKSRDRQLDLNGFPWNENLQRK